MNECSPCAVLAFSKVKDLCSIRHPRDAERLLDVFLSRPSEALDYDFSYRRSIGTIAELYHGSRQSLDLYRFAQSSISYKGILSKRSNLLVS